MTYSTSKEIRYDNSQMDICMFYPAPTAKFQKGKYTVEIYVDRALIGTAALTLR